LLGLCAEHDLDGWALFPTGDETTAFVARQHARLSKQLLLTTPPWPVLLWAHDKRLLHQLGESLGIDQPETRYPGDAKDLDLGMHYPVVVKPASKPDFNRLTAAKAWRADDTEQLERRYREACELMDPELLMVQEMIPGGGEHQFSFAALCADGEARATLVARRTRQFPADFGRASTYVETVDCPEIEAPSLRLLQTLRFEGIVEVEFKRDPRDGRFKLLDVNPRVWGWHTLGARAGIDFPYLLWRQIHGLSVQAPTARLGVRWVRTSTDMPTSIREILRGRMSLSAYLRSLRGPVESAIFASDDPLPGLLEPAVIVRLLFRRMRRGQGV
jgi:predicted ATP-grasp superfamily ATP-dependent carboligase